MSMFTLAISCLNTSNLLWFVYLTFQVPMQYCCLQHQTLLLSSVTSTTECCFCFCSIPSFFLELFLHWSTVAYWAPTDRGVHLSVSYLFACSYCSWGSQCKNTEVVCIPFSSGAHFVRTLYHELSVALHGVTHGFIELDKAVVHVISLIIFLWLWFSFCLPSDR